MPGKKVITALACLPLKCDIGIRVSPALLTRALAESHEKIVRGIWRKYCQKLEKTRPTLESVGQ